MLDDADVERGAIREDELVGRGGVDWGGLRREALQDAGTVDERAAIAVAPLDDGAGSTADAMLPREGVERAFACHYRHKARLYRGMSPQSESLRDGRKAVADYLR